MDRSLALSHVHRVREGKSGLGAKAVLQTVVKIKGLEKLDLKTVKELMKQDDEVSALSLEPVLCLWEGRGRRG